MARNRQWMSEMGRWYGNMHEWHAGTELEKRGERDVDPAPRWRNNRDTVLAIIVLALAFFLIAWVVWMYGTGIGRAATHGSPAYFANNVSYLDAGSSQLWACDHSRNGWRERAEAQMNSGRDIFVRDPDGAGGSCGIRDTSVKWDKHRMWGARDLNPGAWSGH
jgi:cbb3-type cytochrome oxidase subunit 3